jgi:ATP-dependent DNA helicase RecG
LYQCAINPKNQEVGLIERYGSGIRRIINICKNHGIIEPVFEEKPNGFMVTVFKKNLKETDVPENDSDRVTDRDPDKVPDRVPDRVPEHLTENHRALLNLIAQDSTVSMSQMSEHIGISKRKVLDNINKLKAMGIVIRVGKKKGGHWQIIDK